MEFFPPAPALSVRQSAYPWQQRVIYQGGELRVPHGEFTLRRKTGDKVQTFFLVGPVSYRLGPTEIELLTTGRFIYDNDEQGPLEIGIGVPPVLAGPHGTRLEVIRTAHWVFMKVDEGSVDVQVPGPFWPLEENGQGLRAVTDPCELEAELESYYMSHCEIPFLSKSAVVASALTPMQEANFAIRLGEISPQISDHHISLEQRQALLLDLSAGERNVSALLAGPAVDVLRDWVMSELEGDPPEGTALAWFDHVVAALATGEAGESTEAALAFASEYPDEDLAAQALYLCRLKALARGDVDAAARLKSELTTRFPSSRWSKSVDLPLSPAPRLVDPVKSGPPG